MTVEYVEEDALAHIGVLKRSGRYAWGSGDNPHQRNKSFINYVDDLKKQGMSEAQIAKGMDITTTELRAAKQIAKTESRAADASQALRLKDSGMSNVAIGTEMGINESSVRALLNPANRDRDEVLNSTANMLKNSVAEKGYIDIGAGVELGLDVSKEKLNTAVAMLQEEGYVMAYPKVEQLGTGKFTTLKVLAPPGTEPSDIYNNTDRIKTIDDISDDGGRTFTKLQPPLSIDSSRLMVKYGNEGGADMDGVVLVRRGVDDVSLGGSKYAQVRIAIDGTHYIKGMAMYSDKLPDGVDLMFNTNKNPKASMLDALKPMKTNPDGTIDEANPFGSAIKRQLLDHDSDGKPRVTSGMNLVNEEGDWNDWSVNLSSQMLSKQSPLLAKTQLGLSHDLKKADYDEIMSLTNPTVRRKLLESFADDADASAVHLKAAGLPRQRTQVILPINSLKDNEVYAPQFRNGEQVVLVRYPHGGIFEIPELTVNNKNREGGSLMKQATDAIGINSKVAERLSGADFDGDTVLVIPNNNRGVKTASPLEALKGFDPQRDYPGFEGMPPMVSKQQEMGKISNLITDMTIKGAPHSEIAKAVKHSMVVIDAEKHNLNYKQSAKDNSIKQLTAKYQMKADGKAGGASTLISQASSTVRVPERKLRAAKDGGPVDKATGRIMYEYTNETYVDKSGKTVTKLMPGSSTRMFETNDARTLVSSPGTPMEFLYADHANKLKGLGNEARKSAIAIKPRPVEDSARKTYARELDSLNSKLNIALKNAPVERQAQLIANATVKAKRQANPNMDNADVKKIKGMALEEARHRTGATKQRIVIEPREWEAIQSGAMSDNKLRKILNNTDLDNVRKLATPRTTAAVSPAKLARAQNMLSSGYTQSEIADALGMPTSTLNDALNS